MVKVEKQKKEASQVKKNNVFGLISVVILFFGFLCTGCGSTPTEQVVPPYKLEEVNKVNYGKVIKIIYVNGGYETEKTLMAAMREIEKKYRVRGIPWAFFPGINREEAWGAYVPVE